MAGRGADGWGCGDVGLALNGQISLGPARIDATGHFKPYLAVDDRAGRAFDISRQELAELYRDQLRGAVRQYRSTHNLTSWLRGTALALLVLAAYLLWLRLQGVLNQRLRQGIARGTTPWLRG